MIQGTVRSILVATDLGESSTEVVRGAAALASAAGAELHVLHALDLGAPPFGLAEAGEIRSFPERTEQAEEALREQVGRLVPPGVKVHPRVINYAPHRAIREHAESVGADLIVLGPHRGGDVGARFLGTTADRVIRTAEVPCLVVSGPLALPLRRIAAPVDFSEPARGALDVAVGWSSWLGRSGGGGSGERPDLRVFHVGWTVDRADDPGLDEKLTRRLGEELKEAEQRSGGAEAARVPLDVVWGVDPAEAITAYAQEHELDLLVMGTHGYSGVKRFLIGSVATGVARQAPCPVLLVPPALAHRITTGPDAWEARVRLRRVLAAVDHSEPSMEAAQWAVRHFAPDAEHHFVHVLDVEEPPAFLGGPTARRREHLQAAREEADTRVRGWARSLVGSEPVVIREGRPVPQILRTAEELRPDVVVVGEHGRRGLQGWLGSTAERLLAESPVPVLVARRLPAAAPQRVLAAVDESDLSTGVLLWARHLSDRFGASLQVVYLLDSARYRAPYIAGEAGAEMLMEEDRAAALRWLQQRVRAAGLLSDAARVEVGRGEPGAGIVDIATREGAELIVMGSRGAGSGGRLLLGSVSRVALRRAPCPVLIVRDPHEGRDERPRS